MFSAALSTSCSCATVSWNTSVVNQSPSPKSDENREGTAVIKKAEAIVLGRYFFSPLDSFSSYKGLRLKASRGCCKSVSGKRCLILSKLS